MRRQTIHSVLHLGGTALNNSPIEIHVKMSDFKTPFLCSGYIYCTFYTHDHFEHILIFNINLVTLGVIRGNILLRSLIGRPQFPESDGKPDDALEGGFLRGPYFLGEFRNWAVSHHIS